MKLIEVWDYYPAGGGNGIINLIKTVKPELTSLLEYCSDDDYHLGHSGDKEISPLLEKFLINGVITPTVGQRIALIIANRFGENWQRTYKAIIAEYAPLENYDMTEETTHGKKVTRTPDITHHTDNTNTASLTGYNSAEFNDTDKGHGIGDVTETGTETHENSGVDKLTRHGNIGVTTSAQMLQGEINVRMFDMAERIYTDIDKIMTCPLYN